MARSGYFAAALFSTFVLLAPFPVSARPASSDAAQLDRATTLFRLGRFEESATIYEQLFLKHPNQPELLYNLAQTQRLAGNHERALFLYRRYLASSNEASNRDEVSRRIDELERIVTPRPSPAPPAPSPAPPAPPASALVEVDASAAKLAQPTPARGARRWWIWTTVGVLAGAGLAVGLGVGLSRREPAFQSPYRDIGPGVAP